MEINMIRFEKLTSTLGCQLVFCVCWFLSTLLIKQMNLIVGNEYNEINGTCELHSRALKLSKLG